MTGGASDWLMLLIFAIVPWFAGGIGFLVFWGMIAGAFVMLCDAIGGRQ